MAGSADGFLKVSIAAAALFASVSVGYYFVLYLPQRDAQTERERRLDAARAELTKQADEARRTDERRRSEERQAAERRERDERQAADREAAQNRYRECVTNAERNYSASWTAQCKKQTDRAKKDRADCLAKSDKASCDLLSPVVELTADCSLSTEAQARA